jgi:hypothetical protein
MRPEQIPADVLPVSSERVTACSRTNRQFTYLERCPIARHEFYVARELEKTRGYFLLSRVPGQARVADAWVKSDDVGEWIALYSVAAQIALETGDVAEITAASALDTGQRALEEAGFTRFRTLPVMVFDPKQLLASAPPTHWQMIDNDFSFLHQGRAEYET